jgi:hypothetical protein
VLEVIADGLTGLIGETDGELAELCSMVGSLNRAVCRAEAERRFSARSMADGYEVVYRRLLRPNAAEGALQDRQLVPVAS